jgi:uncharacterized membrane protein YdjX (TVP38/TMEM64 family)
MRRSKIVYLAIIAVIVGVLLWLDFSYLKITPDTIRSAVLSFGWVSPFIYIFLYIVRPFVLFPSSILAIAGGLAFGTIFALIYTVIGELLGALLSFLFARKIGRSFFRGKNDPRLAKLENAMARRGFMAVLLLRMTPIVPFDLVSYAAGIARVSVKAFTLATFIGALPGTFVYSFMGSSIMSGSWKRYVVAGAVYAASITLSLLLRKWTARTVD